MDIERLIRKMTKELVARTRWQPGRVPLASEFPTTLEDLELLKKQFSEFQNEWSQGTPVIRVKHRTCGGEIVCVHYNDNDGYHYRCDGNDTEEGWGFCGYSISEGTARAIDQGTFLYTELPETVDSLAKWPEKLMWLYPPGHSNQGLYSSLQPISREDLMEQRVRRILALRGIK